MKKMLLIAVLFVWGLAACASGKNTATQQPAECGHLEICHAGHHHHNSRHHHEGRLHDHSEQGKAEQASD